jgi:hypothetical protein
VNDDLTAAVCALWAEALGTDEIGPDDDFFEAGGNSITAIRMLPEIKNRFGVEPGVAVVFDNPTPRELAGALASFAAGAVVE